MWANKSWKSWWSKKETNLISKTNQERKQTINENLDVESKEK